MRGRISFLLRLFLAFAVSTLIASFLLVLFTREILYTERVALATGHAIAQAHQIRTLVEHEEDQTRLDDIFSTVKGSGARLTLIDGSGRVLRDTHVASDQLPGLDSHADRPEIEHAKSEGLGTASRRSTSLGLDAVYAAVSLENGDSLRIAVPLAEIKRQFQDAAWPITKAMALAAVLCLLLSFVMTGRARRRITAMSEAVRSISLDRPSQRLRDVPGSEYLPLADAVNNMADNLEQSMDVIQDQRNQLETILESMGEGVLVLDAGGRIRLWNCALERAFPQITTVSGRRIIEVIPVPQLQNRVTELLKGNAIDPVQFEYPSGRFFVAQLSSPVEPSEALGAVIVFYDATELLRLERVRKDFISNVSHELRTPLTAISNSAELLLGCPDLDGDYRGFAETISRQTSTLKKVIMDLFDLARLENSDQTIPMENLVPGEAFDEAFELCRSQVEAKGVRVLVDMPDAQVVANERLLVQVFRNLLENACRYAPQGSEIRVHGEARGHDVLFTIADQGPGIPRQELERIFERFYQVKKERNSGTAGIGLAICKHIIERHNGRIRAESPYGDAATAMLFTLPAVPAKNKDTQGYYDKRM